jgi:hypothetical protein
MTLVKVRYKGLSDVRVMSKADLAAAGVEVESQLKWDRTNLHTVHIDGMSGLRRSSRRKEHSLSRRSMRRPARRSRPSSREVPRMTPARLWSTSHRRHLLAPLGAVARPDPWPASNCVVTSDCMESSQRKGSWRLLVVAHCVDTNLVLS